MVAAILHETIQNLDVVLSNPERDAEFVGCFLHLLLPLLLDDSVQLSQAGLAGWRRALKMREHLCRDLLTVFVPSGDAYASDEEVVDLYVVVWCGRVALCVCGLSASHGS